MAYCNATLKELLSTFYEYEEQNLSLLWLCHWETEHFYLLLTSKHISPYDSPVVQSFNCTWSYSIFPGYILRHCKNIRKFLLFYLSDAGIKKSSTSFFLQLASIQVNLIPCSLNGEKRDELHDERDSIATVAAKSFYVGYQLTTHSQNQFIFKHFKAWQVNPFTWFFFFFFLQVRTFHVFCCVFVVIC